MSNKKRERRERQQADAASTASDAGPPQRDGPAGSDQEDSPDQQDQGDARVDSAGPAADLDQRLAETEDRRLRALAELENTRRRARLDVEEARRYGAASLLQSLLDVLDTLQRALAHAPAAEGEAAGFIEGVHLTEQQLLAVLTTHGVTPVPAEPGQPFDPAMHRALYEEPTDTHEPGTIVTELVRGYRLHDRLLREAQVAVARRPLPPSDEDAPHADL